MPVPLGCDLAGGVVSGGSALLAFGVEGEVGFGVVGGVGLGGGVSKSRGVSAAGVAGKVQRSSCGKRRGRRRQCGGCHWRCKRADVGEGWCSGGGCWQ